MHLHLFSEIANSLLNERETDTPVSGCSGSLLGAFLFPLKTGSLVAQTILELAVQPRMTENF